MKFKLNIHAHSIFSDGHNSPYTMALTAKELGFSALVLTDHLYGNDPSYDYCSINNRTYNVRKIHCQEASEEVLPVIEGIEIPIGGEEVLLFGVDAIKTVVSAGKMTVDDLIWLRGNTECAVILCHPHINYEPLIPYIDGYELYNSCQHQFRGREIADGLKSLQRWSNSDAHNKNRLDWSYNILDIPIIDEHGLIEYIKSGKQHELYNLYDDTKQCNTFTGDEVIK